MIRSEFETWLQGHMACFAIVREHFGRLSDGQKETMETAWYGVLRNVDQKDALDATNRMVADPKLQPAGGAKEDRVPRHITKIRDLSEDSRDRRLYGQWAGENGERRVVCPHCNDSAWVSIRLTESGDGRTGVTTCPFCGLGRDEFKKRAPRGHAHSPERHLAWVESVLVPAGERKKQNAETARAQRERLNRAISARDAPRDREPPRDSEEGFQHVSEEIPF